MKNIDRKVVHWLGLALMLTVLMTACGGITSTPAESAVADVTPSKRPPTDAPKTAGPSTGDIAPDFTLPDSNGSAVTFSDELKKNRSVVLVFYNAHD